MDGLVASGATLVSSTLESVGFFYQAYLLEVFREPFQSSIGMLFYVVGIIMGLGIYVLSGRYKFGFWALVGPALFFACVLNRSEVGPADWRFGGRVVVKDATKHGVCESLESQTILKKMSDYDFSNCYSESPDPPKAKVSSVFAWYEQLLSYSIQQVTYLFVQGRQRAVDQVIARAELVAIAKTSKILDVGLEELFQNAFMHECREAVEFAEKAHAQDRTDSERMEAKIRLDQILGSKVVELDGRALDYVARLSVDYPSLFEEMVNIAETGKDVNALHSLLDQKENVSNRVTDDLSPKEVRERVSKFKNNGKNRVYTCSQIWGLSYLGIHDSARHAVRSLEEKAMHLRISPRAFLCDLKKLTVPYDTDADTDENCKNLHGDVYFSEENPKPPLLLYGVIAKYIMRNSILDPDLTSSIYQRISRSVNTFSRVKSPNTFSAAEAERIIQDLGVYEYKPKLQKIAQSMPYYQGLVLFYLCIAFPFFALMLLLPKKHVVFIRWFQLWAWVKLWDVGFAFVMYADQILFNLFSTAELPFDASDAAKPASQLDPDLVQVLYSLRELDPSFRMGNYYFIVSTLFIAVPPVLGKIILGAFGSGASLISGAIENYASYTSKGHALAQGERRMMQNNYRAQQSAMRRSARGQWESERSGGVLPSMGDSPGFISALKPGVNMAMDAMGFSMGNQGVNLPGPDALKGINSSELRKASLASTGITTSSGGVVGVLGLLSGLKPSHQIKSYMSKDALEGKLGSFINKVSNGSSGLGKLTNSVAGGAQDGFEKVGEFASGAYEKGLDLVGTNAVFQQIGSPKVQRDYMASGIIAGGLPIAWVGQEMGAKQDFELRVMENLDFWVNILGFSSSTLVAPSLKNSSVLKKGAGVTTAAAVGGAYALNEISKDGEGPDTDTYRVSDYINSNEKRSRERIIKALLNGLHPNNPDRIELREMLEEGRVSDGEVAIRISRALEWERKRKKDEGGDENEVASID